MRKLLHAARASLVLMLFLIGANSTWAQTYCGGSTYTCSYGYNISKFETSGAATNISNSSTCSATGYGDYTSQVMEAYQGSVFSFTVSLGYSYNYLGVNIFIDWNNDGDWTDAGEKVFTTTSYASSTTLTGTVEVPTGADLGETRIRVQAVNSWADYYAACSSMTWTYGEIEDYTIDILEAPDCAETAFDTDIVLTAVDSICPSYSFVLSLADVPMVSGATRTWQSSPAGTGTWTTMTGTSLAYTVTAGITAATDYRFILTCTETGTSDTSNVKTIEVKPATECYCTPVSGSSFYGCTYYRIDNFVTTGGIDNISNLNTNCAGTSAYGNYTTDAGMLASQWQGSTINYSVKTEYAYGTTSMYTGMWADWNQDGVFSSSEQIFTTYASSASAITGTFEVPTTATGGMTRIRIKTGSSYSVTDPCSWGYEYYGEVEDYNFEVLVPDPCDEVTMTSVTLDGPEAVCSGSQAFTITSSGGPIASGLSKVWESRSPAGSGTWTTITGASSSFLAVTSITAETEYRLTITCTATGESTTDTWTVGLNPPTECYCEPVMYGCSYYQISDFWTEDATIDISNLDNGCGGSDGSTAGGYSDFSDMGATAFQGTLVDFNIGLSTTYQSARMWIDWDQSGTFDSDEIVYNPPASSYAPMAINGSFEVPFDAVEGTTGVRIRTWGGYGYSYFDGCYSSVWSDGETEDYTFTVVAPAPCDEVAFTGLEIEAPENICAAVGFTIYSTGTPVASGITRIWQSKTETGAWTTMTGTSLNYTVAAGITESMSYRYINICTLNGESDTSNVWTISMNPPLECYCVAEFSGAWYMDMYTWYDYKIKDVILNGQTDTLKSLNTPFPFDGTTLGDLGGYTDYTSDTPTLHIPDLVQTGTYAGQVKVRYSQTAVRVWIDLDDDGVFESTEAIYTSPVDWMAAPSTSAPANFTWTVPEDANPGIHRMRVRTASIYAVPSISTWSPMDPCVTYDYGQTQDYLVEVKKLQDCDEVTFPTSVMAYSSPPNVCGTGDIQLRLGTTMPLAAGITYQWKSSSTEDGTYTDVGSPILGILGPVTNVAGVSEDTYFKCYILCEGDPILISDAVLVQSVNLEDVEITMEDGQTCGPGPVTLRGTTTDGSIFWYENAEGGSPISMGDSFVTESLSTDKTYYATGGAYGASGGEVGTGSGTSSIYAYGPFTPYYGAKQTQMMYTKAELNEAGITMGGDIESLAFNIASLPSTALSNYKISLKLVTTAPPISWQTSGWTEVYDGSFDPTVTGWHTFAFDTPFEWDGSSNIMVKICYLAPDESSYYSGTGGTYKYTSKSGQILNHALYYDYTSDKCGATYGSDYYYYLPNAKFFIPGCETDRVPVTAYVRPVPAPVNIGADETVCKDPAGGRTLDVGVLPDTYTRLWNTEETTQTIRITESGTYSIIVANEYGCEVYDTVVKTLLEIPIVDLGEDRTVCEGGSVTLDAGDDGTYYMWNTGATTNTYEAYSEGTYNVLVENSAGCISLDTIKLVFEGHMPSVGSIITTNTGAYTFNFEPILVNEYVTEYRWDFGDSSAISESENPTHTYAEPGSYTVTLTVYSSCGEMTYTTTTHILGVNSANIDDKSVNLYPNPAKDIAMIESKGNLKMKTVTVTNVLGQVMYQGEATAANKHQLELSAYASGLYTVRIETDKGFIVRKFEIIK